MGFFDKLKNFGSKIISGVRRGWDFVKDRVVPVVRRVWNVAKPIADQVIPGSKPITDMVENTARRIGNVVGIK